MRLFYLLIGILALVSVYFSIDGYLNCSGSYVRGLFWFDCIKGAK